MRKLFLIFILFCSNWAIATDEPILAPTASPKETWAQRAVNSNIAISNWFDSVAEGIDLFLAGKQLTKKKNGSSVRFEENISSKEGREQIKDFSIGVVLRLPNVEEYWQLKFTSYDEQQERRKSQTKYYRETPRQENYAATIGLFRKLGSVRTAFQPRIQLQNPISVSHSLSFESVAKMKDYNVNPKLELYAVADKGTGVYWALNFNINLSQQHSLTFINYGDYISQQHLESVTNGFSIEQVISDHKAFSFGTNFFSNNQPNYHLDGYSFFISWNQVLKKKILDYSITPHLDFFREDSFRGRAGISFNIGLTF